MEDISCPACRGWKCKGGGNIQCIKRDPRPSRLFGILDTYGGLRFVVTYKSEIKHHKRHDELAIMVPDLTVHEPIAWDDIPIVIERITMVVAQWIDNNRPNEEWAQEAITMYRIRRLEGVRRSLDLNTIVET